MAKVFVPYNLRKLTDGATQVDVPGATLGDLVANLEAKFPGFGEYVLEDGRLKPGLAAVCGHAATRQGLLQKLDEDTEVHFVPAVSGGQFG
jgi:molybdopterin synthase sulfur carrier subunit